MADGFSPSDIAAITSAIAAVTSVAIAAMVYYHSIKEGRDIRFVGHDPTAIVPSSVVDEGNFYVILPFHNFGGKAGQLLSWDLDLANDAKRLRTGTVSYECLDFFPILIGPYREHWGRIHIKIRASSVSSDLHSKPRDVWEELGEAQSPHTIGQLNYRVTTKKGREMRTGTITIEEGGRAGDYGAGARDRGCG
jgi:hypothetical protein